ncbi:MAG TPA: TetR/AcrR family transcriptional regulator [Steroidobacteraceae bacterium]|jgi:AcrR family transcriptional regulator
MSTSKAAPTANKPGHALLQEGHPTPVCAKPRVRDRIFETACDLFYKHGIRDVGVDTIATEAGTNKMSFYRSFASKDELVAEYLEQKGREFWVWWDDIVAAHEGDPRRQIEALFDAYVTSTCFADSRGCAFANASVEIADEEHPARQVAIKQKAEMRRRLSELAAQAGAAKAHELGDALMLVMEGGYLTRRTFGHGNGPLQSAALTARALIDAYTPKA